MMCVWLFGGWHRCIFSPLTRLVWPFICNLGLLQTHWTHGT
jgi:hypothetical protein